MKRIFLVAILASAGCAVTRVGRDFDADAVKEFKVGVTKKADVKTRLGEPWQRLIDQTQRETWVYQYVVGRGKIDAATVFVPGYMGASADTRVKALSLTFDGEALAEFKCTLPPEEPPEKPDIPPEQYSEYRQP